MEFGVKRLANGKAKDIEGYQVEIFKIGGSIIISHIHKLFNLAVKQGSLNPGHKSSLFLFLKMGIEAFPLIIGPL
jgi:hypothetical protein